MRALIFLYAMTVSKPSHNCGDYRSLEQPGTEEEWEDLVYLLNHKSESESEFQIENPPNVAWYESFVPGRSDPSNCHGLMARRVRFDLYTVPTVIIKAPIDFDNTTVLTPDRDLTVCLNSGNIGPAGKQ